MYVQVRGLFISVFLFVLSVTGIAQNRASPYTLSVLYNVDKWEEFTNTATHSQDTLWYINFRYTEHQDTVFQLKLTFPRTDLPAGYDQIKIDWGNGQTEDLAFSNDTARADCQYYVGKFPLKITLASSSGGLPEQIYEHFVFNKGLSGRVELTGRNGICREKRQQADTFLLRLVDHQDNPPGYMYYDTYLNPDVDWVGKDSVRISVINSRPTGAGDSAYIIVKKPLGNYQLWVGFKLTCQNQSVSPYFLSALVQSQIPVKLYEKPDLKDVFSFADTIERPMRICTKNDLFQAVDVDAENGGYFMSFQENVEDIYKDEYSLPALDGQKQCEILVYSKDSLTDPNWKSVVDTVFSVSANTLLFNKGGYYKVGIIAENRCGIDTLWTDNVRNSSYKRLIRVYEGSDPQLLNCLTEKQCVNLDKRIVFTDNIKRLLDEPLPDYSFNIKRDDWELTEGEDYHFSVQSVRTDSAVVTLNLMADSTGLYTIEFSRDNKLCSRISRSFNVKIGKRPDVFLDTLGKHLIETHGFALKEDVYVGCDTFCYVLPDLSNAINSNQFDVDSIAFYLTRGSRVDTLLYGEHPAGFLFDSTDCTGKIQIAVRNYCGWKTFESYKEIDKYRLNLFVHKRPDVILQRDRLSLQDTICAGIEYSYSLQGFDALTQIDSMQMDRDIVLGNHGLVQAGKTVTLAVNPFTVRHMTPGKTKETFIIINRNSPGCKQFLYDSVVIAQAPDRMAYRDSILYCESVPAFTAKALFGKENPLFNWAEWHWKGDNSKGKGVFLDQILSLQGKGKGVNDTLQITTFQHKGCFLTDSVVFIPKVAPDFSLQDRGDTCVMGSQVIYNLERPISWNGNKPWGTKIDLYKDVFEINHRIPYAPGVSLALDNQTEDTVKVIYHIYNSLADTLFGACGRVDTFALRVFKPQIQINKKDTLQTSSGWTYAFSRMDGRLSDGRNFIDTVDLNPGTLKWTRNGVKIIGDNYSVTGNERELDSLIFMLEGESLCGVHLKDSLVVYIPRAKIQGFRAKICSDTRNFPLWGEGKAQGYFIDPNTLKWKIINLPASGKDWGSLAPAVGEIGEGEAVNYTPGDGILPGDTVKIEVTGSNLNNSGIGIDTIYLQVNPQVEYHIYKDTLITKERELNIRHIAPKFVTIKNYKDLFISHIYGIGQLVGDSIYRFDETDYPVTGSSLNYSGSIRIMIQGMEGCSALYTPKLEITDPVKVKIRPKTQVKICNGDSIALKALLTISGEDQHTRYSWKELNGVTGQFNQDSSFYTVSTGLENISLSVEAYKTYVAYTGELITPDVLGSVAQLGIEVNLRPGITIHTPLPALCQGGSALDLSQVVDIANESAIKWESFENGGWLETDPSCSPGESVGIKSYRVSALSDNICPDSVMNIDIPVLAAPEVVFSVNTYPVCQEGEIDFLPAGSAEVSAYLWNFGDGAISTDMLGSHIYDRTGEFPVELMVSYGTGSAACTRSWMKYITVSAKPIADFIPADGVQVSGNSVVDFVDQSSGAVINSWKWTFGTDAPYTGTGNETYEFTVPSSDVPVKLAVTTPEGCQDSVTHVLRVVEAPVAEFSVHYDKCSGEVSFNTTAIVVNDATVHWDFGDGRTLDNAMPSSVFEYETYRDTTYRIILTLENAAALVRDTQYVTLVSRLEAGVEILPANGCNKIDKEIRNITQGSADWIEVQWGDGSPHQYWENVVPVEKLSHRYINETTDVETYRVLLIASNECKTDTAIDDIRVLPLTVGVSIEVDPDLKYSNECFGEARGFINRSYGFNASGYHCDWFFEEGTLIRNNNIHVSHVFEKAGDYWVKLKVGDNCNELVDSVLVNVQGNENLRFATSNNIFCERQSVVFESITAGANEFSVLKWGFSDGHKLSGPQAERSFQAGEHKIWLYGESENCPTFSDTLTIGVLQTPQPLYTLNGGEDVHEGCCPFKVDFAGRDGNNLNSVAYWDFKDNATSGNMNETHHFGKEGEYEVVFRLTAPNSCRDSVIIPVQVLHSPIVSFDVNNTLFCTDDGNFDVVFTNTSQDISRSSFEWWKEEERFAIVPNPERIVFNNTFGHIDFKLKATDRETHCSTVIDRSVFASRKVSVDFTVSPLDGCEGAPVVFERDSGGSIGRPDIVKISWDLGDGVMVTDEQRISHTYDRSGQYTVRLKVENEDGCETSKERMHSVFPLPVADFSWEKDNTMSGLPDSLKLPLVETGGIRFHDHSFCPSQYLDNNLSYYWTFGDSFSSTDKSPKHRYPNNGNYEVMLMVKTVHGCADSLKDRISIDAVKGLFIPNAFAPGASDEGIALFQPKGVGLFRYQIQIYGPGGVCVWNSNKLVDGRPAEAWDGTFKGELLPKGVYLWDIHALFIDGTMWTGMEGKTKGGVTLIR